MRNKIRERRVSLFISQEELSRRTGISRTSLVYIENGEQIPKIDSAKKIADALHSSIEEIFLPAEQHANYKLRSLKTTETQNGGGD